MILPLNENNLLILKNELSKSVRLDIPAIDINTNQRVTFKIDTDYAGALLCEIFNDTRDTRNLYLSGTSNWLKYSLKFHWQKPLMITNESPTTFYHPILYIKIMLHGALTSKVA